MAIKYKLAPKVNPRKVDDPRKFYAVAIHEKTFKLKELAKELAARSTTASEGDTYSVLIGLRDLIREHLNRSDKVIIDGIGSLKVNLSSEGAETIESFHPSMIKKAKIDYREDTEMKEFTSNVKFEKIPDSK